MFRYRSMTLGLASCVMSVATPLRAQEGTDAAERVLVPAIDGDWWQVAGNPDVGKHTTDGQQVVDFAVWQAADGSWQIWACIRLTSYPGFGRLFYRWEGARLTDTDWKPIGVAMTSDTRMGETEGGLQA